MRDKDRFRPKSIYCNNCESLEKEEGKEYNTYYCENPKGNDNAFEGNGKCEGFKIKSIGNTKKRG